MKKRHHRQIQFALCVTDREPDLQLRKVYRVLRDESASRNNYLRVVDESGGDYLYPASYFVFVRLPKKVEPVLLVAP